MALTEDNPTGIWSTLVTAGSDPAVEPVISAVTPIDDDPMFGEALALDQLVAQAIDADIERSVAEEATTPAPVVEAVDTTLPAIEIIPVEDVSVAPAPAPIAVDAPPAPILESSAAPSVVDPLTDGPLVEPVWERPDETAQLYVESPIPAPTVEPAPMPAPETTVEGAPTVLAWLASQSDADQPQVDDAADGAVVSDVWDAADAADEAAAAAIADEEVADEEVLDEVDSQTAEPAPLMGGTNFAAVRAMRSEVRDAQRQLETLVMSGSDTLSARDRMLVAMVVAAENRCEYWLHHVCERLEAWFTPDQIDVLVHNWNEGDIEIRERAMLAFSVKLCLLPSQMSEQDARMLANVGFGDEDLLDIVDVVSYWSFNARVADGLGVFVEYDEVDADDTAEVQAV